MQLNHWGFTPHHPRGPGFTLIETLLYLALFSIIIGGVLVSAYQIILASTASQESALIQEEGHFLVAKINWALTGATLVSVTSPTFLQIDKFGYPDNPITFDGSTENLIIQKGVNPSFILNSDSVTVTSVTGVDFFIHTPGTGGKPDAIQATFRATSKLTGKYQDFSTTKYLRQ